MTPDRHHRDHADTETPEARREGESERVGAAGDDPRTTSHPAGEEQAAKNAENEPAG